MTEKFLIEDSINVAIPEDKATQFITEFKKIQDSADSGKYLEVEVDVTHGGYVNRNFYYYSTDGQARAAKTFISPFQKPVLVSHNGEMIPIGRSVSAAFIPLQVPDNKKNDLKTPKSKIRVKSVITDQKAIEDILTKRLMTVSSGGLPRTPPRCSVCDAEIKSIYDRCEHMRGQVYDSEKSKKQTLCYWKIDEMVYHEYSFVNTPADQTDKHAATIVSMRWTNSMEAQDSVTMPGEVEDSNIDYIDTKLMDSIETPTSKSTGGTDMSAEKQKLLDQLFDSLTVLDCDDCKDGEGEWKAEETKELDALDALFSSVMEAILGDKVLPKAGSKERESMNANTFCGPNRTFPVPDCKHAATAMAMLKFPDVVSKYSASVRSRIASCVRNKAKSMNCAMSKSKDAYEKIETQLADAIKQIEALKPELEKNKAKIQELDAEQKVGQDKITKLTSDMKRRMAEKVVDMSLLAQRPLVNDILSAEKPEDRKTKYNAHVEKIMARTEDSLNDAIADLSDEVDVSFKPADKLGDPTISDKKEDKKEDKPPQKSVADKVWGTIAAKKEKATGK